MILFILAVLCGAVFWGALAVGLISKSGTPGRTDGLITAAVAGIVGLIFLLFSCTAMVGTQDVGVLTTFGKPAANGLSNGLHLKAPWAKVHTLDDAVQTDTYASNGYDGSLQQGAQDGCINVRIARQATACVNATIRWQIPDKNVGPLFRNYKNNSNIRDNLLHRDLQKAVNVAFTDYDPLALNSIGDSTQPTTTALGNNVAQALQTEIGDDLKVLSVQIPLFNFDPQTQQRINQLQAQVAQTRIATQSQQTASAQAKANRLLAASVNHAPGVLESQCLNILSEAVNKGQALPAGFSCFGSTGTAIAVK